MKYFCVKAKCGHVGRDYYYEGEFFVEATCAKEAAKITRQLPRVKHHHKYAILGVYEVSYQVFLEGQAAYFANPYFSCKSKREQERFVEALQMKIFPDSEKAKAQKSNEDRLSKLKLKKKWQRKSCKHALCLIEA